jgi:hypothetical protein
MSKAAKALDFQKEIKEAITIMKPVVVEDDALEKLFTEWRDLKQQFAVLDMVRKKVEGRISELEKEVMDITKSAHGQQVTIDESIAKYASRKTTSVPYKSVFEKALEISTADQRKILEDYKEAITNRGVSESIKIIDPKLEAYLESMKYMTPAELLASLTNIKEIPDDVSGIQEKTLENYLMSEGQIWDKFKAAISKAWSTIKSGFNKWRSSVNKGTKSANDLLKAAYAPIKES